MNNTKCAVALCNRIDQYAHGADIEDVRKVHILALHLSPDTVDMLRPAAHLSMYSLLLEDGVELFNHTLDRRQTFITPLFETNRDLAVLLRLQIAQ